MLPATATIPVAIAIGLILLWYWMHLGSEHFPSSRRRIRRASVVLMVISLPIFVRAISLNHTRQPTEFVIWWTLAAFLVFLVVVTAGLDVLNSMKLQRDRQIDEAARDIAAMINAARESREQPEQEDENS